MFTITDLILPSVVDLLKTYYLLVRIPFRRIINVSKGWIVGWIHVHEDMGFQSQVYVVTLKLHIHHNLI